nr:cell division topological specificity factor MinE [Armatimonas rosea]
MAGSRKRPRVTLLERIFGKSEDKSKSVAKDRLKLVLMHDRADIPAPMMEQMRQEIIAVIAKYVEINEADLKVDLERADTTVALVANIPIRRVRG